jgi:ProQ/FINO family
LLDGNGLMNTKCSLSGQRLQTVKHNPLTTKPRSDTARAVVAKLAEKFSECFFVYERRRKPLKAGIHHNILEATDDIPARELTRPLRSQCLLSERHCRRRRSHRPCRQYGRQGHRRTSSSRPAEA